jgi:hypothetical protein
MEYNTGYDNRKTECIIMYNDMGAFKSLALTPKQIKLNLNETIDTINANKIILDKYVNRQYLQYNKNILDEFTLKYSMKYNVNITLNKITNNKHFWSIIHMIEEWPDRLDVQVFNINNIIGLNSFKKNITFVKQHINTYIEIIKLILIKSNLINQLEPTDVNNFVSHIIMSGEAQYVAYIQNRHDSDNFFQHYIFTYHNAYDFIMSL